MNIKEYNEEALKISREANFGRPYQQCTLSVMDTIADPDISFDENGICNYYWEYQQAEATAVFKGEVGKEKLTDAVNKIKDAGKGKEYDCILGLSGGADSSYLALLAKQNGLRPLVVHFDYGWNLELAVQNIEQIIKRLDYNLYTIVMDWKEMKSLQRAYFKASVLDLDVPADHMIFGSLYQTANKFGIRYILSGKNIVTEAVLPKAWNYNKFDLKNLKNINKRFENGTLNKLPALGVWDFGYYAAIKKIETIELLNFVEYNKNDVKELISRELGWRDYGGKHHENIFTRFYQGYVLPVKFGIDKRKAHLSNLIFSGQLSKEEALMELTKLPYEADQLKDDFEFVSKKLGFTIAEFEKLISQPNKAHAEYGTDEKQRKLYWLILKNISPVTKLLKKISRSKK